MRSLFTEKDLEKLKAKYADEINKTKDETGTPQQSTPTDDRISAIAKLIPGEAVAIFLGLFPILKLALDTTPVDQIAWIMFFFCLSVAIIIAFFKGITERITIQGLQRQVKNPGTIVKTILTGVAFVIWAFNIEGFVAIIPNYDPVIGNVVLLTYTVLIPEVYKYLPKD